MRPVSAKFLTTIRGSHTAVFRATLCTSFQSGTSPAGTDLPIIGGNVKLSATADVYGTLELTTAGEWPRDDDTSLAPYGNEIYVERGIEYAVGQREWVGLGYFRIDTLEQDEAPDGPLDISGSDRSAGINDARFGTPRQFASSLTRGQLVSLLINEVYPAALIDWDDTALRDGTVGRAVIEERDRGGVLRDFIKSLGKVGYWDYRGRYAIKTPPSTTGAADWAVDAGRAGVLVQMKRALTREGVYNAFIATGEAADTVTPVVGTAYNLDPTSPTYYRGLFGPVPGFYSSPFLTTTAQCVNAAAAQLRQQLGIPYQVKLSSVPNAAIEPWDVLDAVYPKQARRQSYWTERHVVDGLTIPLDTSTALDIDTRQQQTELIGDSA